MTWTVSAFADEAGNTTAEQIAALKRAGLKHIDPRGVEGHNISALPLDVARTVKKQLDNAGITVTMFGSPIGKIDVSDDFEIDLGKLRHLGELARIMDCNQVRIFSYYNGKNTQTPEQWKKTALDQLRRLRDLAGKLGLVLFHENESGIFGSHGENNLAIAQTVRDGKVFKMIFDFDNYNREPSDDTWKNWLALRDYTDAFHLKDSDKDHCHVPIGQGIGRAKEILTDALARRWQGPLSIEPHLRHSKAVVATHVSGSENKSFADLSQADCFHVAAEAATKLLTAIGAKWQ